MTDSFRQERKKTKVTSEDVGQVPATEAFSADIPQAPDSSQPPAGGIPMPTRQQTGNPLDDVHAFQRQAGITVGGQETPGEQHIGDVVAKPMEGINISGNLPPAMQQALQQRIAEVEGGGDEEVMAIMPDMEIPSSPMGQMGPMDTMTPQPQLSQLKTNDPSLNALLAGLSTQNYEEIMLPSRGVFYESPDTPTEGVLHMRPMTGQEESILSTVRFMRGGRGIEMIFRNCIQEKNINPEKFLSIDRTYLLIYLRAISYGHLYEVNVRCPDCNHQFDYEIDLNLPIDYCPERFTKTSLTKQLPKTKYMFTYQLMTGSIETQVSQYRDHKSKFANATDDTFLYRAAVQITEMGNKEVKVNQRQAIQALVERLPAQDVNYIRNCLNDPPFGVNTEIKVTCPACMSNFEVELPYEANFFFPREMTEDMQP